MLFDRIHGQDSAIATLRHALARERLAHAYLFKGPAGVGKKKTALTLAQAILCREQPREGCGTCAACASVAARTHPDLTVLALEMGKQAVVIDQIRDLQRLLILKPVSGGKKIAILEDAHLLTAQAQSALLKVVEEPPGDALLILLTVNAVMLSRPLVSRCQQVRFAALPLQAVKTVLRQEHGKDDAVAQLLALHSRGSIGRALALDPEVFMEECRYIEEEVQKLGKSSFTDLSRFAGWLVADRVRKSSQAAEKEMDHSTGGRLELMLSWYEEVLRYAVLGQEGIICYGDRSPTIAHQAATFGVNGALRQLTLVYDTIQALGRNANKQLAVEDMLLQLGTRG